jgi:hypothetical protein
MKARRAKAFAGAECYETVSVVMWRETVQRKFEMIEHGD